MRVWTVYSVCVFSVGLAAVRFLPGAPAGTSGIYSSAATGGRPRLRVRFALVSSVGRARSAAGVTWSLVIASAPWGARAKHTSVVDAAGAVYVIGGSKGHSAYNDV